jgi:hypothetical protein
MSNTPDHIIDMKPFYKHVGRCSAVEGTVAEVGLGEGHAANSILSNAKCKAVDSFEINPIAVAHYKAQKALDTRHKILEQNFITQPGSRKYSFIYIDTLYGDEASADNTIAILEIAKTRLVKKGRIAVEFWADDKSERRVRNWMKANLAEHESERCGDRGMAKLYIKYWTVK